MALTAPSLCPRCDAPALTADECTHCALPLRRCGSCFGVAGPFDRYCGFCGHELVLGRKQSRAWRLWLVAGLVPILVALGIGLSPIGQAAVQGVTGEGSKPAAGHPNVKDTALRFTATEPSGWGYTRSGTASYDVLGHAAPQGWPGLTFTGASGPFVEVGRPAVAASGVDNKDPVAVLASETAQFLATPPSGFTVATVKPVKAITINGRGGAEALFSVTDAGGNSSVYERAYLLAPNGQLFLFIAYGTNGDLPQFQAVLSSIRLTG